MTLSIEEQPEDSVYSGKWAVVWRKANGEIFSMRMAEDHEVLLWQIGASLDNLYSELGTIQESLKAIDKNTF